MGHCCAPCGGKVSAAEYAARVDKALAFLKGDYKRTLQEMKEEMMQAAANLEFEKAAALRDRIRSIETKGETMVDEGIRSEFIGIVNYGIIALIQLELGYAEVDDMTPETALAKYDEYAAKALELMKAKNHDYDEAWRSMRISSYTDLILMKIYRTKQIESNEGQTIVSEGIDANYMDMINYSVFGLIKIDFGE